MKLILLFFILLHVRLIADDNAALYYHGNCITCHHSSQEISAPSMIDIKARYLSAFSQKKEFVEYMSKWVHTPSVEMSIMQDAIEKHQLMPELAFDLETLKIISAYIYETNFETVDP